MMTSVLKTLLVAIGVALVIATPAKAEFDLAADFSIASNPNGPWSYGYSTTLTGTLVLNSESGTTPTGLDYWRTDIEFGVPLSLHNPTALIVNYGTVTLQPGQFAFHPGPAGQYEKVRLIVDSPATYLISGSFAGVDVFGTSTDVHILLNGISIFDGNVSGFGPSTGPSFSLIRELTPTDELFFAVGFGSNGSVFNDSTALSAHISQVPENSIFISLTIGIVALSLASRRKA
jgi:hypothetical protein